jgi:ATP-dependent protease ClpP protease subunit
MLKSARLFLTSEIAESVANTAKAKELYLSLTQKSEPLEGISVPL